MPQNEIDRSNPYLSGPQFTYNYLVNKRKEMSVPGCITDYPLWEEVFAKEISEKRADNEKVEAYAKKQREESAIKWTNKIEEEGIFGFESFFRIGYKDLIWQDEELKEALLKVFDNYANQAVDERVVLHFHRVIDMHLMLLTVIMVK